MSSIRNKRTQKKSSNGVKKNTRVLSAKRSRAGVAKKMRVNRKSRVGKKRSQKKQKSLRSITRRQYTKKVRQSKKQRGGDESNEETLPIPLLIDNDDDTRIDEDELNQMEMDLANDSFASYDRDATSRNSIANESEGETTSEDISFENDEDEDEDEENDILNTAFYEDM